MLLDGYSPLRSKAKIILNKNRVFISDDEGTLLSQLFNKSHQTYLQFFQIKLEINSKLFLYPGKAAFFGFCFRNKLTKYFNLPF